MTPQEQLAHDIETLSTEEFAEKYNNVDATSLVEEYDLDKLEDLIEDLEYFEETGDAAPVKRGRGRPKGSTSGSYKRRGDAGAGDSGSEPRGIIQQLGHAADNPEGAKVTFKSGETHHVRRPEAHKALLHFSKPHNEKPDAKSALAKKLGHSKAHFYDALASGKGDTPAGPKKISLARGATYDPSTKKYAKEEVEVVTENAEVSHVTPATADFMNGLAGAARVAREIMAQNIDLRKMAEDKEFQSRNGNK